MQLAAFDLAVIVIYFLLLSAIGVYFSRRQTTQEEYYLGERKMHWLLVGGSVLATLLSTITYLSLPGEMIRYGLTFLSGVVMVPLAVPVVSRLIVPTIRRLPINSAYEYLDRRFGPATRRLASTIFLAHTLVWTGLIFYTASLAITQITGWQLLPTIIAMGLITIFYTTLGGIRAVIWTDNLQLLILFGGALVIPAVVMSLTGEGPGAWWSRFENAGRADVVLFSWDPTVRMTVFSVFLNIFCWEMCTHSSDQVAVQRYLTTPDMDTARKSLWTYAAARILLGLLLAFCGLALFGFYSHRAGLPPAEFQKQIAGQADKLLPRFIASELPGGISGLLIAALLAAAMSSLSSGMNAVAGVVRADWLPARAGESLRRDKLIVAAAGLFGMTVATTVHYLISATGWNLVEMTGRLNHIFVGPLASLFFVGVLSTRASQPAAILGFIAGGLLSLYICFSKVSFTYVVPGSVFTAVVVAIIASRFFARPEAARVDNLTYSTVMGRS